MCSWEQVDSLEGFCSQGPPKLHTAKPPGQLLPQPHTASWDRALAVAAGASVSEERTRNMTVSCQVLP